jgi:aspartate-semialdehyde dehydrogenase
VKANIAIVGATGLVGSTIINVLEEKDFPIKNIYFFASANSIGEEIKFKGKTYYVKELKEDSFDNQIDIAFFAIEAKLSLKYAKIASNKGIVVIDNSSAWRMHNDIALVVPEVNKHLLINHHNIIANPNCTTIQAVIPLDVIHKNYQIKRIVFSTYQAVSGSGFPGIVDLVNGLEGKAPKFYIKPIAYNCLPHIDDFTDNWYTKEEMKLINETKKLLNAPDIKINATCVRVPVLTGHSVSINVECEKEFEIEELIEKLKAKEGLVIFDNPYYPTPNDAKGQDLVYVGRIRRDDSIKNGLNMWVVADNIRKGAASNAIQIAEIVWKEKSNGVI